MIFDFIATFFFLALQKVISSNVTQFDMDKLQSIFKQLYREWSAEGKEERDASFKPILDEIVLRFPPNEV